MKLSKKDIKVDRFRATGNGGQNVNTRETAIRLTYLPTGTQAQSQDERNQNQNYKRALEVLTERVEAEKSAERKSAMDALRDEQIGSGVKRIRTYNFTTNTVTDHRTGVKIQALDAVLNGDLHLLQ